MRVCWFQTMRWEREIEERNRELTDEDLDAMLPSEGYKILEPPAGYVMLFHSTWLPSPSFFLHTV